jgi:nucleotide-binding universal stress UspA family protein
VVGVDGSRHARSALKWASDEARQRGAAVEAVTAWHLPLQFSTPRDALGTYDFERAASEMLDRELGAVLGDDPVEVVPRVERRSTAEVLIEASRGADLLVVGSRGHGEFAGMLLGAVGLHCVAHAHCPVVVVRGGEEKSNADA